MKIKALGFTSFEITNDNVVLVTDPNFPETLGMRVGKVSADIAIYSQKKLEGKSNIFEITPINREKVFEITGSGEYEISDLLIQRPIGMPYYILDFGYTRIIYVGVESKGITKEMFSDLGDVEVLILPVGDGNTFANYDVLQDIISEVEPTTLIPCGYMQKGIKTDITLKTKEEFLKHFGFSTYSEEKTFKVSGKLEEEEKQMNIVFVE